MSDLGVVEGAAGDLDAIRKRAEAAAQGYRHTPQWAVDVLALVADREALLAERDEYRDAMLRAKALVKDPDFGWGVIARQQTAKAEALEGALRDLVESLDAEAGLTMSRRLADTWSNARQALYEFRAVLAGGEAVPDRCGKRRGEALCTCGWPDLSCTIGCPGGEVAGQGEEKS